MSTYEQFDAELAKLGWTFDGVDEVLRDHDGQMIDPENVMAALPSDTSWCEFSAWAESRR